MKIGIIGQGAAGLVLAIMLKRKNNKDDIFVFDKNQIIGRKLFVTGNGRCNLANLKIDRYSYNNQFAFDLVKDFDAIKQIGFFKELGLGTRNIGQLVYPFSLSAKAFTSYLVKVAKDLKIKFVNDIDILDYFVEDKIKIISENKVFIVDRLVISTGGKAHPILGSDGLFFEVLKKHKYKLTPLKAGLAPIKIRENVKSIENERLKANVSLFIDKQFIYKEEGEVLFKKDGLSGISIFNCASMIARDPGFKKASIVLDLFSDIKEEMLFKKFQQDNKVCRWNFLEGYFSKNIAEYIRKSAKCKNLMTFDSQELKKIVKCVKNMEFEYGSTYSLSDAQVSVGGIDLKMIDNNLQSTIEKNVYFAGEVLAMDGLCGGYNLMLCFSEAKRICDKIN